MKKIELLLPAGDFRKMETAIRFGADAVYAGGEEFSLRRACENFSVPEIRKAVNYCHEHSKKFYLALNIFPRVSQFSALSRFLDKIRDIPIDALIVSDLGILELLREKKSDFPIHISTQANILNHYAVKFLKKLFVKRIILARELNFSEIRSIHRANPDVELEIFVHGAMCVSYSGRCLLSNYFNLRDSNLGDCSQPCRWEYFLTEKSRPDVNLPVIENDGGTFIFNSRDLCLIRKLPEIIRSGISSIKIEGRVKSEYYLAVAGRIYREALDLAEKKRFEVNPEWLSELQKLSNRQYTEGFFPGNPDPSEMMRINQGGYVKSFQPVGKILKNTIKGTLIEVRNNIRNGDQLEIFTPSGTYNELISEIRSDGKTVESVTNQKTALIRFSRSYAAGSFLRKKIS